MGMDIFATALQRILRKQIGQFGSYTRENTAINIVVERSLVL